MLPFHIGLFSTQCPVYLVSQIKRRHKFAIQINVKVVMYIKNNIAQNFNI